VAERKENAMADFYLGEIRLFPYPFVPNDWHACDGSLLSVSQYSALFSLLGTYFGGDGVSNFALPDLRSRVAIGVGQGGSLAPYTLGQKTGVETVTLTANQVPQHNHTIGVSTSAASSSNPQNAFLAQPTGSYERTPVTVSSYAAAATSGTTLAPGSVSSFGGGQSHNNIQPVQALQYCIALTGIYPTRG